jgi:hypothetical protein
LFHNATTIAEITIIIEISIRYAIKAKAGADVAICNFIPDKTSRERLAGRSL